MPGTGYITSDLIAIGTNAYMKPGVELNSALQAYAVAVASKLSFPVIISSGVRSVSAQTSAIIGKLKADPSGTDLYRTYADDAIVADILKTDRSSGAVAAVIAQYLAMGRLMSDHMRGDALDFRVRGLSSSELAKLQSAAIATGGEAPLVENLGTENEHMHVEGIGSGNYLATITSAASEPSTLLFGLGVASFVVAAGYYFWHSRKKS